MLDLDDPLIEECEVGHGAGRSVLEMESDLDAPSRSVGPDFVVDAVVAIVELEQHRVHAVPESRQLRREVRPRICHDHREEIAPVQTGWTVARSVRG
jgi:hypothetical protein